MSARAPFVPRPASRMDVTPAPEKAQNQVSHTAADYEPFRPNGLLDVGPAPDSHPAPASAGFKPLNLSGLGKIKSGPPNGAPVRSRPSVDGAALPARSPNLFAPGPQKHLVNPRPSSPFFPNSGLVSMNLFRASLPSTHSHQAPENEDLSPNRAHIVSAPDMIAPGDRNVIPNKSHSAPPSDSFCFLDPSLATSRSRTVSHPYLDSIHEVDEEHETVGPRKSASMGPPPSIASGMRSGNYSEDISDLTDGLRRATKRADRETDGEEDFDYGVETKRYKVASHQDEYAVAFSGRATPAQYPACRFNRAATPVQEMPLLPPNDVRMVKRDLNEKSALYRLLGQDFETCVEAHADAYEQARKKWSECSVEEWKSGADVLAQRFANMLDFVKDHMSVKLALYSSLHDTISQHRTVLSEREQTLTEARENLLREGGAVVGSGSSMMVMNGEDPNQNA